MRLRAQDGASGVAYGILYDNMAAATFDLGCEHSNYYGLYRSYEAADGDLDFYVIFGPSIKQVLSRWVLGLLNTQVVSRWVLGLLDKKVVTGCRWSKHSQGCIKCLQRALVAAVKVAYHKTDTGATQ